MFYDFTLSNFASLNGNILPVIIGFRVNDETGDLKFNYLNKYNFNRIDFDLTFSNLDSF